MRYEEDFPKFENCCNLNTDLSCEPYESNECLPDYTENDIVLIPMCLVDGRTTSVRIKRNAKASEALHSYLSTLSMSKDIWNHFALFTKLSLGRWRKLQEDDRPFDVYLEGCFSSVSNCIFAKRWFFSPYKIKEVLNDKIGYQFSLIEDRYFFSLKNYDKKSSSLTHMSSEEFMNCLSDNILYLSVPVCECEVYFNAIKYSNVICYIHQIGISFRCTEVNRWILPIQKVSHSAMTCVKYTVSRSNESITIEAFLPDLNEIKIISPNCDLIYDSFLLAKNELIVNYNLTTANNLYDV